MWRASANGHVEPNKLGVQSNVASSARHVAGNGDHPYPYSAYYMRPVSDQTILTRDFAFEFGPLIVGMMRYLIAMCVSIITGSQFFFFD